MRQPDEIPDRVADAPRDNWVDRYAPPRWRPWLKLSRADRPIGTWLLLLPCWWGLALGMLATGPQWRDLWIAFAVVIGSFVMRGAGCTWNDITDRHIDAQVARTRARPLPSGQATVRGAYIWLAIQLVVGLVILLSLGWPAIFWGILSLGPVAIYPFAKRFTWWPQLFLGVAFNWGLLVSYVAHTGAIGWPAACGWLAGIAWTLHYDTIYAHQDVEDDALVGVKSTARLFGDHSPTILRGFAALAVILLAMALGPAMATTPVGGALFEGWSVAFATLGLCGFAAHLTNQLGRFEPTNGPSCLRLFHSNRDAGLILAVFLVISGLVRSV